MQYRLTETMGAARARMLGVMAPVLVFVMAAEVLGAVPCQSGQVWLVSTRSVRCCGPTGAGVQQFRYWRYEGGRPWQPVTAEQFLQSSPGVPTTIFVHGNQTDADKAIRDGWQIYCQMERMAAGRPFRFVIWSWPADRLATRARVDAQYKAAYSDVEAFHLADGLRRFDPAAAVSLVGYSFGARIITGGLHLLGGGTLTGCCLPAPGAGERLVAARPMRAVLVAAGTDADWLLPGHRNGLALTQVEQMLVTVNGCDRVLRWYPRLYGRRGPQAMGYVGPAGYGTTGKIEVVNVSCSVGRVHDWAVYSQAPGLIWRLPQYTFLDLVVAASRTVPAALGARMDRETLLAPTPLQLKRSGATALRSGEGPKERVAAR